jgi:hypothetical protein
MADKPGAGSAPKEQPSGAATIAAMRIGECGWADPMALAPLRDGTCFLHGGFAVQSEADAVARMKIERIVGGWMVYASQVKNSNWRVSRGLPWPGVNEVDLMPVAKIV